MFFDYHSNKISIYWKIIFWFSRITAALKHYRANQIQDEFYSSRTDVLSHDPWVRIDNWVERIIMWSAEGYRRWCWIIVVLIRLFIIKMKPLFWIEVKGNCTKLSDFVLGTEMPCPPGKTSDNGYTPGCECMYQVYWCKYYKLRNRTVIWWKN